MRKRIQMTVDTRVLAHARDLMLRMGMTPEIRNGVESPADIIRTMIDLSLIVYNGANYYGNAPSIESQQLFESSEKIPSQSSRRANLIAATANMKTGGFPMEAIRENPSTPTETSFNVNITNKMKQCDLEKMTYFIEQFNNSIAQSNPDNRVEVSDYLAMKDQEDQRSIERYAKILACLWLDRNHDSPDSSELERFWRIDQEKETLIAKEANPLFKDIKGNIKAAYQNQSAEGRSE